MSTGTILEVEKATPETGAAPAVPAAPTYTPFRPIFSHSLLEVSSMASRRRTGSALVSVIFQTLIVGVLILLPLWFTEVLPAQQLTMFLVAPPPPPAPPPPAAPELKTTKMVSQIINGQLLAPSKIPKKVQMIEEKETPPPAVGVMGGVVGGVPGGQAGGVIGSLLSAANHSSVPQAGEVPKRLRISQGVSLGLIEHQVEPDYPIIARRAHVQGTVQLRAVISPRGTIENLQLIQGHPMLVSAAMEAVRQWHYRPYLLSGEPVEVETTILVNFHIDR
jgi:protein TonB